MIFKQGLVLMGLMVGATAMSATLYTTTEVAGKEYSISLKAHSFNTVVL